MEGHQSRQRTKSTKTDRTIPQPAWDARLRRDKDGALRFDRKADGTWTTWRVRSAGERILRIYGYGPGERVPEKLFQRLWSENAIYAVTEKVRASESAEPSIQTHRVREGTASARSTGSGSISTTYRAPEPGEWFATRTTRRVGGRGSGGHAASRGAVRRQPAEQTAPPPGKGAHLRRNADGILFFRRPSSVGWTTWHVTGAGEAWLRDHGVKAGQRMPAEFFRQLRERQMIYTGGSGPSGDPIELTPASGQEREFVFEPFIAAPPAKVLFPHRPATITKPATNEPEIDTPEPALSKAVKPTKRVKQSTAACEPSQRAPKPARPSFGARQTVRRRAKRAIDQLPLLPTETQQVAIPLMPQETKQAAIPLGPPATAPDVREWLRSRADLVAPPPSEAKPEVVVSPPSPRAEDDGEYQPEPIDDLLRLFVRTEFAAGSMAVSPSEIVPEAPAMPLTPASTAGAWFRWLRVIAVLLLALLVVAVVVVLFG